MLQVQVSKADLRTVRAVDVPLSALPDGAARLQVKLFALSANNITYATMGESILRYWDFFPAPPGWGCTPCWGFADVVESRAPGVAIGMRFYGYFPLAETLDVMPGNISNRGFSDGMPHRANKPAVYNQYHLTTADPLYDLDFEPEQVLFRPTFAPGWWLADFVHRDNPCAIIMSSASSKSALATACQLRRLGDHRLIGLTSARNIGYVRGTGLYHDVMDYDDIALLAADAPATYVDFLGREGLTKQVHEVLGTKLIRSVLFGATDWDDKPGGVQPLNAVVKGPKPEFFFTSTHRDARIDEEPALGAAMQRDMRAFYLDSRRFVTIRHHRGADEIVACWKRLLSADIDPGEGLALQF
jgi:hypothetical protein